MFHAGKCSIYECRPYTCHQYDCRVFAATGISADKEGKEIAQRVDNWEFQFSRPESEALYQSVRLAARFLRDYASQLPAEIIPVTPAQQSVMAIRIYELFSSEADDHVCDKIDSLIEGVSKIYLE